MAYDIIEPEKGHEAIDCYLKYFLKSKFISENLTKAIKTKEKVREGGTCVFTMNGEVLRPGEVSSGGWKKGETSIKGENVSKKAEELRLKMEENTKEIQRLESDGLLGKIVTVKQNLTQCELMCGKRKGEKMLNEQERMRLSNN